MLSQQEQIEIDSESTLKEVKDILITFLESSSELGPKANDIKRRLNMMEEMWANGKLNKRIHLQMKELACGIYIFFSFHYKYELKITGYYALLTSFNFCSSQR